MSITPQNVAIIYYDNIIVHLSGWPIHVLYVILFQVLLAVELILKKLPIMRRCTENARGEESKEVSK